MSSEPIEGEPSHLEAIPIFSPSITTLDVSSKPISKPILDPNDSLYAPFAESHYDPRNPPRHPKHRSDEGHRKTKKSNNNGWRILRTYVSLPLNGWMRPWTRTIRESPIQGKYWTIK
jgi:hypothetical protein